ncbi:hypothetical protein EON64_03985, partial [archaeon]
MVIQSLSNTYSRIPDEEDVTPLDRPDRLMLFRKRSQKHCLMLMFLSAFSIILLCIWRLASLHNDPVHVVYTSVDKLSGFHTLTLDEVQTSLPQIQSLSFGNVGCKFNQCASLGESTGHVFVDSTLRYQKLLGFGGAFTEASAHNFYKLSKPQQERFLALYFSESGLQLNMGRVHINSCDFSLSSYAFDNVTDDFQLKHFDDSPEVGLLRHFRNAVDCDPSLLRTVAVTQVVPSGYHDGSLTNTLRDFPNITRMIMMIPEGMWTNKSQKALL